MNQQNPNPPEVNPGEIIPSLKELVERAERIQSNLELHGVQMIRGRLEMIRQGIRRIFQMRAIKLVRGLPIEDEFEPWLINEYKREKKSGDFQSYQSLITTGMLQPNCLDDWSVDRKEADVSRRLGIRSFTALQELTDLHKTQAKIGVEIGPGDGLLLHQLQNQNPDWIYLGVGDRLYFSLERLLMKFTGQLSEPSLQKFIDIFFLFVKREFKKRYQKQLGKEIDQGGIDLNALYDILLSVQEWIRGYFEPLGGSFRKSEEFELDTAAHMDEEVLRLFHELLSSTDVLVFFQKIFSFEFLQSFSVPAAERLDLNRFPSFNDRGFVPLRFEDIDQLVHHDDMNLSAQVSYLFGCRSDSHLHGTAYVDFLSKVLFFLKPGGVYISDGVKESYTRILRYEGILHLLQREEYAGKYRAMAVVDRETGRSLSVYIEAGAPVDGTYIYYSYEQLARAFDISKIELFPLEEIISRERYETLLREEIFRELDFSRDAFYLVNDAIEAAADLIKRAHPTDLLSAMETVSMLSHHPPVVDEDVLYKHQIFCEAIMALFEIRLEVLLKDASLKKEQRKDRSSKEKG